MTDDHSPGWMEEAIGVEKTDEARREYLKASKAWYELWYAWQMIFTATDEERVRRISQAMLRLGDILWPGE